MLKNNFKAYLPVLKNFFRPSYTPFFCTYSITWRCNAQCTMCHVWKKKSREMTVEDVDRVFKQIPTLTGVRITGGEPFLREDISEIVDAIDRNTNTNIFMVTTNGVLIKRIIHFVKSCKKRKLRLKISLNGYENTHDQVVGINGAFEKALILIEQLKILQKSQNFYFGINHTIFDKNSYKDAVKIRSLCRENKLSYLPVIAYDRVPLYSEKNDVLKDPAQEKYFNFTVDEIKLIVDELQQATNEISNPWERFFKMYYLNGLFNNNKSPEIKCTILKNHIRIAPDGVMPVCLYNATPVGNLLEDGFDGVWQGTKIKEMRHWVNNCSKCWQQCDIFPNLIYSNKIIKYLFQHGLTNLNRYFRKKRSFVFDGLLNKNVKK